MSDTTHRENFDELRRRVIEESGLGRPDPYVSPSVAILLGDLLAELGAVVLELELLREIHDRRPTIGG